MKRGSKRPVLSDLDPNPADSSLRSKRVVDEPSLDAKRAETARQHVRALNTQFASWVQLQLQNHPDEIWEDGAKDYVSHASHIVEKFKDVVDWLRTKAALSENAVMAGAPVDHNKCVAVLGNNKPTLKFEVNNGFTRENKFSSLQSSSLSNSHSSGLLSVSQTAASSSCLQNSGLSGSQNSGFFSKNQKPASSSLQNSGLSSSQGAASSGFSHTLANSSLQTSGLSGCQTSGFFGISQTPASSSLQSSSLSSLQGSGLFGFSQTPSSSNLQSSGLFSSQSSGLFSFSRMPACTNLQSSSLPSSQSSGQFGFGQTPASSNLQSTGLSSPQSSGLFSSNLKPVNSSSQASGLSSSQSSGVFAINKTPVFGGTQSSSAPRIEASEVADEDNELEQPSSPSLKKSEEKGIVIVHEVKCKVYVKPDNPEDKAWKDMGVGQLSIKCKEGVSKATKDSKPTIIVRNDVGKILLNALIYPGIKMNIKKNTIASIFHTSGSGQNGAEASGKSNVATRTYLLRLKTEDETAKLAAAIQDCTPSA